MYNYFESDYARNKYARGMVYQSECTGTRFKITLEDYLAENPDDNEDDFNYWKKLSDSMYLDEVRTTNTKTKRNTSYECVEYFVASSDLPLDEQIIEWEDNANASKVIRRMSEGDELTEIQRRRFALYVFKGLNLRDIADIEGVCYQRISKSIIAALKKVNKIFAE